MSNIAHCTSLAFICLLTWNYISFGKSEEKPRDEGRAKTGMGGANSGFNTESLALRSLTSSTPPAESLSVQGLRSRTDLTLPYACTPSPYNYSCSSPIGSGTVTLHWSVSTSSTPSENACTTGVVVNTSLASGVAGVTSYLHLAASAQTTGWVSLAFASTVAVMSPSTAVIGWVDSSSGGNVAAYSVNSYTVSTSDIISHWAVYMGVAQINSSTTIICFGVPATGALTASGRRRSLTSTASSVYTVDLSAEQEMNWAATGNGKTGLVQHDWKDGLRFSPATGSVVDVASGRGPLAAFHGVCMILAWVLVMPIGMIIARHKWMFGTRDCCGKRTWFQTHMWLQLSGFVLFAVGIVVAFFSLHVAKGDGHAALAHLIMGLLVVAFVCFQIVFAFIRPGPASKNRWIWNLLHWYLGRICIVLAWAEVYLGIAISQLALFNTPLYVWLIPVVLVNVVVLGFDLRLEVHAWVQGGLSKLNNAPRPMGTSSQITPEFSNLETSPIVNTNHFFIEVKSPRTPR